MEAQALRKMVQLCKVSISSHWTEVQNLSVCHNYFVAIAGAMILS